MKTQTEANRFNIDFHEFCFLVEACIPPRPIARMHFWDKVINQHYHVLTDNERKRLYTWIKGNVFFDLKNENCLLFDERYDPENQYTVKTNFRGKEESRACFKHNDMYCISKNTFILEAYIIDVQKLVPVYNETH